MAAKKATPAELDLGDDAIPAVELTPANAAANKVTTIRLTETEYAQSQLICQALDNTSLTEFAGKAIRAYIKACLADPKVRKEVQRQITKQRQALDHFAKSVLGEDE